MNSTIKEYITNKLDFSNERMVRIKNNSDSPRTPDDMRWDLGYWSGVSACLMDILNMIEDADK